MNIKEIIEGMTAPQVAQVIKDNFYEVDKDKANKTETDAKLSELGSNIADDSSFQNIMNRDIMQKMSYTLVDTVINDYGKAIGKNFDESSSEGYSGIIEVKEGQLYVISTYKYASEYYPLVLFKTDDSFVGYDDRIYDAGINTNVEILIPRGVNRLVINSDKKENIFVKIAHIDEQVNKACYSNLNDVLKSTGITYYNEIAVNIEDNLITNRNSTNIAGKHVSVSVKEGESYLISGYKFGLNEFPLYIFRSNGLIVEYENILPNGNNKNIKVIIPKNVDELIVNTNNENNIQIFDIKGNEKLASLGYILLSIDGEDNVLDRWNGTTTKEGKRYSVNVKEGETYIINSFKYGDNGFPAYLLRKNGSIVSYFNDVLSGMPFGGLKVTIPDGVDELVVNSTIFFCEIWKAEYIEPMRKSNWKGKKILWLGTSIPEKSNYTPNGNYPEQVAKALGAEIRNVALGSSNARKGYLSRVSENDEMGITGVGFITASRALGMTIEEKKDLINNWDSKWDALVTGGTHGSLTDSEKELILSASFENKLIANLEWADLIVFDHGRNDYSGNPSDNVIGSDFYDMRTFQGAMNFYIKKVLETSIDKKIVMISHYETKQFPNLISMQQEVADYWNIPFFRLCDKLGWAYDRTITIQGQWIKYGAGGYYWSNDGISRNYRLTEAHIPDGTHPNTDLSGKASREIAQKIIPFINDIGLTDY